MVKNKDAPNIKIDGNPPGKAGVPVIPPDIVNQACPSSDIPYRLYVPLRWRDKIIRSKRRTLALHVTRDAALVIRAPQRMPLALIEKFIHKKRSWIEEKQRITRARFKKSLPKQFIDGERFFYLGNTYPLSIVDNDAVTISSAFAGDHGLCPRRNAKDVLRRMPLYARGRLSADDPPKPKAKALWRRRVHQGTTGFVYGLSFYNGFYLSKKCLKEAKHLFVRWYKNEAAAKIKERLNWYCSRSGLKYNEFNITSAQKRWGSCTSLNNLNFSWRLIMTPLEIIDYVVTHELTHLTEKNHSKRFWEKLSLLFPGFKQCKIWLKENEHLLTIF